jgi:acyl-CoA synthetase (AMP-forming)/AMP-acid ligase II
MFHAAMVLMARITPLRAGDLTYILPRFELEPFLTAVHHHQITDIVFVPSVVVAVIKYPQIQNYSFESLKIINSGAGPLQKDHQIVFQKLIPPTAHFTQVWGMTETSCVASKFYYPEDDNTGNVGYMMPNLDVNQVMVTISYRLVQP